MKKKLLAMILCMALVIGTCVTLGDTKVKAADGNDNYDVATVLKSNKRITAKFSSENDVDWYVYEVEDSVGVEWVEFKSSIPDQQSYYVQVYSNDEGIPADVLSAPSWGVNVDSHTSREFSFSKGTIIYIKVTTNSYGVDKDYYLTVKTSKKPMNDSKWAEEDNDSYDTATVITSSNKLCGIMNTNDDVDWYKYVVKNDKPFSFKIQSAIPDDKSFYIQVYDNIDGIPANVLSAPSWGVSVNSFTTNEFTYNKGDIIFVKVTGYAGVRYRLSVTDTNTDLGKVETPISILDGTNVIVGKAEENAKIYVQYNGKKYTAEADENGFYRVKTENLVAGKKVKIWQKVGKKTSKKLTVKVAK